MKKLYIMLCTIVVLSISIIAIYENQDEVKYINYNGSKLAISVDGKNVDTMPSGKYFLVGYECGGDTKLTWDYETSTLTYNNINANDRCSLKLESSPKLYDLVEIGDYIEYMGDPNNGCIGNQCNGWNANQTNTDLYENYGYCVAGSKYNNYGWRVLHKTDNSVYIVSAGAPECVTSTQNDSAKTISDLNLAALKYCNSAYISNGICGYDTVHPFNGEDFYFFTSQYYGSANARYLYNYNDGGVYGSPYCYFTHRTTFCGFGNKIIDIGGEYFFGSAHSETSMLFWLENSDFIHNNSSQSSYGLRPVIKLDTSILATGGAGTMEEPYTISERVTETS